MRVDAPWQELWLDGKPRLLILGTLYTQLRNPPDSEELDAAASILALDTAEGRAPAAAGAEANAMQDDAPATAAAAAAAEPSSGSLRTVSCLRNSPHKLPPLGGELVGTE